MIESQRPTVLIVEDEVIVRMETADVFEDAGFRVLEASDAEMALVLLEQHPEIKIVFTDVEMPGAMSGLALAKVISSRWPCIAIMVCSGPIDLSRKRLPDNMPYFIKPYDLKQASSKARTMIAA